MNPQVLQCKTCGKQFQVIAQEQSFLQKQGLPSPTECPSCRQQRRLAMKGSRQLHKTTCQKCGKEIIVSFDPSTVSNPIFCQEDYEKYFAETETIISDPLP